jgi:hypothetical protein
VRLVRFLLAPALAAIALASACTSSDNKPATLPRDALLDPTTCKQCHVDHFTEWSGSMHAYAADDPVFRAMNKRGQRETNGALGDFCVKCHAPMALHEGATKDGLNLDSVPAKLKGVTCFFCHTTDSVQDTHNAPLHLADAPVMRGPFADPVSNTAHQATYSAIHDRDSLDSAKMCGACHDIKTGHGADLERTFAEWQASVFSQPPGGTTCSQCHMAQSANLVPVAQAPGVFARRRHAHTFAAIDRALTPFPETDAQTAEIQAFLATELQSAICVSATGRDVRVFLDNVAAGHDFPSGASQDRRVWVEVNAFAGGSPIYQSGTTADDVPIVKSTDPDLWLMRDCIFDPSGAEVHMFWDAAQTEGNALPAQVTFDSTDPRFYKTHIVRSYPRTGTFSAQADRVTMRVRVQPMGLDVLDELIASGDLDPAVRTQMKTLDVGDTLEWTAATANDSFVEDGVPYSCITKSNFNVKADKVPAVDHVRCKP